MNPEPQPQPQLRKCTLIHVYYIHIYAARVDHVQKVTRPLIRQEGGHNTEALARDIRTAFGSYHKPPLTYAQSARAIPFFPLAKPV